MSIQLLLISFLIVVVSSAKTVNLKNRVVAAVNCGGPDALGAYGIEYSADTSEDGVSSDHGMQYSFNNAEVDDMEIYQTERWSKESFSYDVPISEDGEYVIILKFSEVYFQKAGEKIFNIRINSHLAVKNLDIFDAAGGRGFAHDVYIPVVIKGSSISVSGHSREYKGKVIIELSKGPHDNPKLNGYAILRGTVEDLPSPPEKFIVEDHFPEDFDIYEDDATEDSFKPQIIRGDEPDEEEMYSAPSAAGTENPFEKSFLQETMNIWLPLVAILIVVIPMIYVIQMKNQGTRKD